MIQTFFYLEMSKNVKEINDKLLVKMKRTKYCNQIKFKQKCVIFNFAAVGLRNQIFESILDKFLIILGLNDIINKNWQFFRKDILFS